MHPEPSRLRMHTAINFLMSLSGHPVALGVDGEDGVNGADGADGPNGADGADGPDGVDEGDGADGVTWSEFALANGPFDDYFVVAGSEGDFTL